MIIHKNITIYGIVQGVGFRFSARDAARTFAVRGFVRNLPDGSVYLEAEGPESNISQFIEWCWHGPSNSNVNNVEVADGELKHFNGFDIRF
ncbi:MAG: acylphosphatase [Bacteroidales bacterium]|nr:acylphosphatase [Bacteroidales bacterium]